MTNTFASKHGFRYPSLGDPKPKPNTEVLLIKADGKHELGKWTDDCKAWAIPHASVKKKVPA